jgi:hypothetical protein
MNDTDSIHNSGKSATIVPPISNPLTMILVTRGITLHPHDDQRAA